MIELYFNKGMLKIMGRTKGFFEKKKIKISPKLYFVDAMSSMALGLFSTLLIGTIFATIGTYFKIPVLNEIATFAQSVTGAVIGVAIANTLSAPPLVMYSAAVVGYAGYMLGSTFELNGKAIQLTAGPAGAFVVVIIAVELGKLVSKTTPVDIIVTPAVTIIPGVLIGKFVCPYIAYAMYYIGEFINTATDMQPLMMGIIISVVMGMVLTLPISSAAICAMIGISGLAGGAAAAGCCANMIGFAVISYRENKFGGFIAQGLGTSMLQMGNIVKKPVIWLPAIVSSAVIGALSTTVFKLKCSGVSAGMGTCGLVGPIGIITEMGKLTTFDWVGLILICFILPAIISLIVSEFLRKIKIIKLNDLKLDL